MGARDLIDKTRAFFVDSTSAPTREIIYTRSSDDFEYPTINAFVGGGQFNKEEKDKIENYQSFSGLDLEQKPSSGDTVLYDGQTFKVRRYTKLGQLWVVYGEISRHRGM